MENKINVAELLKDCPKGMELDCTVYNNITLEYVCKSNSLPICVRIQDRGTKFLSKYGQFHDEPYCKCVIFPKGKTTWEGFVPPCKFKDGDIISDPLVTCIFKGEGKIKGTVDYYCGIQPHYFSVKDSKRNPKLHYGSISNYDFATEEEKQKLFDAIKENGYKWNAETKTLEKLIEPKFKVGDKVIRFGYTFIISEVKDDYYLTKCGNKILIDNQDDFRLVPNKFDISTLIPFESRVLARDYENEKWYPAFWGFYDVNSGFPYKLIGCMARYCIPYKGNEHLRGKTDDCDEFYKTWK